MSLGQIKFAFLAKPLKKNFKYLTALISFISCFILLLDVEKRQFLILCLQICETIYCLSSVCHVLTIKNNLQLTVWVLQFFLINKNDLKPLNQKEGWKTFISINSYRRCFYCVNTGPALRLRLYYTDDENNAKIKIRLYLDKDKMYFPFHVKIQEMSHVWV